MYRSIHNVVLASPAVIAIALGTTLIPVQAETLITQAASQDLDLVAPLNKYNQDFQVDPFHQVNNVNQLRDISPHDWSYKALHSLVDRYGCIVGFPSQTYLGNQALTRYEFAAGLNACLQQIERLIASSEAVFREDIEAINRLIQEFAAELASLGGRVDNLENGTAFLEDRQFSTTTKLNGEAIFTAITSNNPKFQGNRNSPERNNSNLTQSTFGFRTTLNFDTSFTGKDRFRTRLRGGDIIPPFQDQTNMGGLDTQIETRGNFAITTLQYRTASIPFIYEEVPEKFYLVVSAFGTGLGEYFFETFNPYIVGTKDGFTQFAIYNPIFRQPRGVGASIGYITSNRLKLAVGYSASGSGNEAADPSPGRGLFNGSFSTGVNTEIVLAEDWILGLTYLYSYSAKDRVFLFGQTGSSLSSDPFNGNPTQAHNFGWQTTALINSQLNLAGWMGWTRALDASSDNEADIFNWALTFVVLDAFQEGNKAGLVVGMPPKLTSIKDGNSDPNSAWQIEAFYSHRVNDRMFLNPGFYVIVNPENDSRNDTIFVGLLRTTFEF